jgi:hypothetical protein
VAKTGSAEASLTSVDDGKKIRSATLTATLIATLFLFLFVWLQAWCSNLGAALTLSGALLVVGYLVGLLFAVPKSVAVTQAVQTGSSTTATDEVTLRSPISVNTNFEQISDWLTKIIVGVGLVQARPIYQAGSVAANQIGEALQCASAKGPGGGAMLGAAILLGFPTLGLILGFFSVRLYISRAVYASDLVTTGTQTIRLISKQASEVVALPSISTLLGSGVGSRRSYRGPDSRWPRYSEKPPNLLSRAQFCANCKFRWHIRRSITKATPWADRPETRGHRRMPRLDEGSSCSSHRR